MNTRYVASGVIDGLQSWWSVDDEQRMVTHLKIMLFFRRGFQSNLFDTRTVHCQAGQWHCAFVEREIARPGR